jgi:hypothetical protein
MSEIRVNNITNRDGTAGPSIAGIPVVDSNSHFVVPTGRTGQRYADGGENIVRDGLVLYLDAKYSYPGATGTNPDVYTWYDMSGNENHGELINGVSYSGTNGGSLVFDGINDYVLVSPSSSIPYASSARSVSIWFYTNTTTWADDVNTLFHYGSGLNSQSFGIDFQAYALMQLYTWGGTGRDFSFSTTYSQVGWKNICVSYNGSTNISIYENGVFTQSFTLISPCNTPANNIYIGAIDPNVIAGGYFDGKIAQVQMYNKALSASEVLQNYNATKSRYGY